MNLSFFLSKFKYFLFLLRKKGFKYALNRLHFFIFNGTKNPLLIRLLYLFEPYPPYLKIETTTRCNLKCKICEHTYWKEPEKDMSFEEFKYIVDQSPRLKWVGPTGIGETFLNKDFLKMLAYAKSKNILVELYDTFYFIDEEISKKLIKIGVDKIYASIDAAIKETYEKIRTGSNFERVINNLKNLFRLKKEMKTSFPEITFHFVVNKMNFQEMPQYVEMVHFLTSEDASIQFTKMLHRFKEVEDLFVEIPEEIRQTTEERAKELGVKLAWNIDTLQIRPPITKCSRWFIPFIFVTGEVVPCCSGTEANRRSFQKEIALGNIFEKNFREMWRGQKYKAFRNMLRRGEIPLPCKDCCLYNVKKFKN